MEREENPPVAAAAVTSRERGTLLALSSDVERKPHRPTCYQDLGLTPSAARKDVERAFWRRQEECRRRGGDEGLRRRIEEAYLTLSDPVRRREYDRRIGCSRHPAWSGAGERRAAELLRRCREHLEGGREKAALANVRRAIAADPGNARSLSYLGLLTARSGGQMRRAVDCAQNAHRMMPGDRTIALNLAAVLDMAGMSRRARRIRRDFRHSRLPFFRRS